MENKDNRIYKIADIPKSCQLTIDKYEKQLKQETDKDIVLVAYQSDVKIK